MLQEFEDSRKMEEEDWTEERKWVIVIKSAFEVFKGILRKGTIFGRYLIGRNQNHENDNKLALVNCFKTEPQGTLKFKRERRKSRKKIKPGLRYFLVKLFIHS